MYKKTYSERVIQGRKNVYQICPTSFYFERIPHFEKRVWATRGVNIDLFYYFPIWNIVDKVWTISENK